MLSKILFTLIILVTAYFFIRGRFAADNKKEKHKEKQTSGQSAKLVRKEQDEFSSDLRFAAYTTVVLLVSLAGVLYYFRWQEDHEVLTITLHRENQAEPISYRVYRFQLQDRSFVTIDGTSVTVAASERMEVLGLDQ